MGLIYDESYGKIIYSASKIRMILKAIVTETS